MTDARREATLLETRGLSVGYAGSCVVAGVDLVVPAGQIVALIGPNGAGKSTILRTIASQLAPLGGLVYCSGRPLEQLTAHERALMCSVLLTERLHTELMSARDVVGTGRYPHTGRLGILSQADHAAVQDAMELVGIWELRERDFMQLSDGQRQRILLARAICQDPRLMVLDEPTAYLDIRHQIELLDVLRHLVATKRVGVVMTLHELSLAREVADWVVCVRDGGIACQGTPSEVFVPEVIDPLYDLTPGTYDPATGAIRLHPQGNAEGAARTSRAAEVFPTGGDDA